jgi:spore coat protein CotF
VFLESRYVCLDNFLNDDTGVMSPEFAMLILVGLAMATTLYLIVTSPSVRQSLADMVDEALSGPD